MDGADIDNHGQKDEHDGSYGQQEALRVDMGMMMQHTKTLPLKNDKRMATESTCILRNYLAGYFQYGRVGDGGSDTFGAAGV